MEPTTAVPIVVDRPVRAAFVGLGRIYDLNRLGYVDNPDVEVVALVDPDEHRRRLRQSDWPDAATFASVDELAASGLAVDSVEALLPIVLHADEVVAMLERGWNVNLQKPICNDLDEAQRDAEGRRLERHACSGSWRTICSTSR